MSTNLIRLVCFCLLLGAGCTGDDRVETQQAEAKSQQAGTNAQQDDSAGADSKQEPIKASEHPSQERTWRTSIRLKGHTNPKASRTWTSNNGKHEVSATVVSDGAEVGLKLKDGKIISVKIAKLSQADRDYLIAIKLNAGVNAIAFSPDNALLASCSADQTIRVWDVATGSEKARLEGQFKKTSGRISMGEAYRSVTFSPDGRIVVGASSETSYDDEAKAFLKGEVVAWDWKQNKRLPEIADLLRSAAFSSNGKYLVALSTPKGRITHIDWATRKRVDKPAEINPEHWPDQITCSPVGNTVAATGWVQSEFGIRVYCWSTETGKLLFSNSCADETQLSYSRDGKMLIAGVGRGISFHSVPSGEVIASMTKRWDIGGKPARVGGLAVSPDGEYLVAGNGYQFAEAKHCQLAIWRIAEKKPFKYLKDHTKGIGRIGFLPDGIAFSQDGSVRLTKGICCVAFSPDGSVLASADTSGAIILWDWRSLIR